MLHAVSIGSNTALSQQALASFPFSDTDNQMLGFAAFVNGFTLTGGGNCIFNSLYPIGGTVTLNGGTLSLSKDLTFQKNITLYKGGIFKGNGKKITFLDTDGLQLPASGTDLLSMAYLTQYDTGASVIACDWSHDNHTIAIANSSSAYIDAFNFVPNALTAGGISSAATTNFLCVAWHPTLNYLATGRKQGSSTKNIQLWQYNPSLDTFTLLDQEAQNKDITAVAWHPSGNYLAVATANGQGIIIYSLVNNALTYVSEVDLTPSRNISNALSWDSTGTYLVAGTASSGANKSYEVLVYSFNGSVLTLNTYLDLNTLVNAVAYCPTSTYIAVGLNSGSDRFRMYAHNPQTGTLTKVSSINLGISLAVLAADWSPDGKYIAFGTAKGSITELNVYAFDADEESLTLVASFHMLGAVNTLKWSSDGSYLAVGDSVDNLSVFGLSTAVIFNGVFLECNSNVTFNTQTIFQGVCMIEGNNHTLQFANQGSLQVASGASLTLKNLTLSNITASSFYCADGTATINFNNVELNLTTNDYTFSNGAFNVINKLRIQGSHTFNYQSNQISTIKAAATLFLDGVTLNYNPSISANNLLAFADSTASLVLRSATFQISNKGLQLTKGHIEIDGKCYIVNSGTQAAQGLLLGDGNSAANNVLVRILPEAQCVVSSGYVVDKSV